MEKNMDTVVLIAVFWGLLEGPTLKLLANPGRFRV